jgi:hypothetical protein
VHRANNNFLVLDKGCKSRIRLFYKNLELKRLKVSAIEREACYATIQGAIKIRRRSNNANIILEQSRL